MTKINVAIGPKIKDNKNQFRTVRFFPCANPALINANVSQLTKYPSFISTSPCLVIYVDLCSCIILLVCYSTMFHDNINLNSKSILAILGPLLENMILNDNYLDDDLPLNSIK